MKSEGRDIDPKGPANARRRLPRFGLRAFLIAILAYCVVLTWLGSRWRALEEQKHILTSLDRFVPGTVFSRGEVVVLSLKSTEIHDEDLRSVGKLTSLEQLDLEYTKITDAGIAHLVGLKNLRYLSIGGTRITDAAMKNIGRLTRLEELLLGGTNVGDAGMNYLCDLRSLRNLD